MGATGGVISPLSALSIALSDYPHVSGLTPQLLLSQQGGVLQQAEKARQAVGQKSTRGAGLPQRQQPPAASVLQKSLCSLRNMKGRGAQLLEPRAVPGLRKGLQRN